MTRLYIIGPVTGIEDDNLQAFVDAANRILDADRTHTSIARIPHMFVDEGDDWPTAMRKSVNEVTSGYYDGLALLPGWEQSEGAKLEKAVAEACGIPCKTVDEWLEEARC